MKSINLTWRQFDRAVEQMAERYKTHNLSHIVGVARGGLPLAVALSNKLDIPLVSLTWQTRDGKIQEVDKLLELRQYDQNVLFIDDICDTGVTIKQIRKQFPSSRWCSWAVKKKGLVEYSILDYSNNDAWITFPWE